MLLMSAFFEKYGVPFHLYTDDTPLYFPLQLKNKEFLGPLLDCLITFMVKAESFSVK